MSARDLFDEPAVLSTLPAAVIGTLVALADDGATPLVLYPGQPPGAALRARTTVDVHGAHVGRAVLLVFDGGDPRLPIVAGVLRPRCEPAFEAAAGQVEADADGRRLVVAAREQLVLRCGKASITLTRAGKVLIEGAYVLSRSTGMNRIKGGAVQIN